VSAASEVARTAKAIELRGVLVVVVRFIELNIPVLRFFCGVRLFIHIRAFSV
jgi:hypothetical protein